MGKLRPALIVLTVCAIFLAAGAVYVYGNENGSHNGNADLNTDGTISFSISGPSTNYSYSVFSDTDAAEKIVLYYDKTYKSDFNSSYTQSEYFGVLKSMLERRGASVMYADAEELVDIMTYHPDYAVVFVSGALPDTVYDGSLTCRFVYWMSQGGSVYWSGPEMGRYVASKTDIQDMGIGFFLGQVNGTEKDKMYAYNESDMFRYTQMRYDDCSYGLRADFTSSRPHSYVSDDGYSSVSVADLFGGNVTVFGGNIATTENVSQVVTDRTCCADLIVCGLTYSSEGLDHGKGDFTGSISSNTKIDVSSYTDVRIWLSTGEPASDWGRCFTVN